VRREHRSVQEYGGYVIGRYEKLRGDATIGVPMSAPASHTSLRFREPHRFSHRRRGAEIVHGSHGGTVVASRSAYWQPKSSGWHMPDHGAVCQRAANETKKATASGGPFPLLRGRCRD